MYTKLRTLFDQIAQQDITVETIRDSAIGASVNLVRNGSSLTIDLALTGPCNLQQLEALLSALLQYRVSFTRVSETKYTTTIAVDNTTLI